MWKVRTRVEIAGFIQGRGVTGVGEPLPDVARRCVGAEAGEEVCDGFGVARGSEEGLDSGGADGGEEVAEVHAKDDGPAGVGNSKGFDGATGDESVDCVMSGDLLEDFGEDSALKLFEANLRSFEKTQAA